MRFLMMAVFVVLGWAYAAVAQDGPKMAPIEQYLMADQSAEIALARSAAPESISRDAEVMVLGHDGFVAAVKGKNGFVCVVGRSFTSAAEADFWDPRVRVPMCFNAAGARSYLIRVTKETGWVLAGQTQAQLNKTIATAIERKELPTMEDGAMCYMMSKQGFGGDTAPHWPSHLMFFFSDVDLLSWGANLPGSPVVGVADPTEHLTQFVIPTSRWSDGTEDLSAIHEKLNHRVHRGPQRKVLRLTHYTKLHERCR